MWEWILANKDWIFDGIGVAAISFITSAVTFIITTVIYQSRKEKIQEKTELFKYLMATRRMRDYHRIRNLNAIDIVFSDCNPVLRAWHDYYDSLGSDNNLIREDSINRETAMLKAMAKNLKYPKSVNERIDKPYFPTWVAVEEGNRYKQGALADVAVRLGNMVDNPPYRPNPQPPPKKKGKC